MRFVLIGSVVVLVFVGSCQSRRRPDGPDTQTGDLPTKIQLEAADAIHSGDCISIALTTINTEGDKRDLPFSLNVLLSADGDSLFFPDSKCSISNAQLEVKAGHHSAEFWFKSLSLGSLRVQAADRSGKLGAGELNLTLLPIVSVKISDGPTYNFGSAYTGTTLEKVFTVSNAGLNPAKDISADTLSPPFSYEGGVFPGTGGTCGSSLAGGNQCTLAVIFSPSAVGVFNQALTLNYSDGVSSQAAARALRGEGVTSGSLDSSFGVSGRQTTAGGSSEDRAMAVLVESDGKVLVAGSSIRSSTSYDTALVRYGSDGQLDGTFGVGGVSITSLFATEDRALAVARRTDGKYVTGGYALVGSNYDFVVARFNSNGSLDTSFGTNGRTTVAVGGSHDYAFALALLSDNRIVLGGYSFDSASSRYQMALVRFTENGAVDEMFGDSGKATAAVGNGSSYCYALGVQSTGKIVAVGHGTVGTSDIAVVRFDSDGRLDHTFGTSGKITIDINSSTDFGYSAAIQSDDKVVIGGTASFSGRSNYAAVRLSVNGAPDSTFDFDGKVYYAVGPSLDEARSVAIQSNGRIVLSGFSYNGLDYDFSLIRLFSDGASDTAFGTQGKLITPVGAGTDRIFASSIDSSGRIVVAGDSLVGSTLDFALARYLP